MINEVEYRRYWDERKKLEKKAKELFETVKECQKEFGWPEFKDDDKLCTYARLKGLLNSDEIRIIREYLFH